MKLLSLWQSSQESIKKSIGEISYDTWFSTIQVKEKNPTTLLIETPDNFFKNWIIEHYKDIIYDTLNEQSSQEVLVEYGVSSHILKKDTKEKIDKIRNHSQQSCEDNTQLNAKFTFENFVIGPSNRFACAASLAVSESPAKAYNPLFIYSPVGLGKTHLLQAITHNIKKNFPDLKHCYLSSEKFTNELIEAIRHKSTNQFRKKYRNIDVLLIDDIQFIAGKESTQEEFFHTFNNLHNKRKQIIITSDRPPKDIAKLEERLISRFAWGLIADIQPPDFETRVAILRKKTENAHVSVPDDVIYFIAEQIKTNIRELEGALIRVSAYAAIEERPINLEMTKFVLKDMVKETVKNITIDMIQKTVVKFYGMSLSDLRAKKRNRNVVLPRQIAIYLSRELTNLSLPEIGNSFGGRDHTTVLHSCKKIQKQLKEDQSIYDAVEKLTTTLKQ
jgi:chromosomal replication initiator protein